MPKLKFVLPGGNYLEPTAHNFPLAKCINFKSSLFKSCTTCSETLYKHQHTCLDHSQCIVGSGRARKYAPEKCGTCLARMLQAQTSTRFSNNLHKHLSLLRAKRKNARASNADDYFLSEDQKQWFFHYVPKRESLCGRYPGPSTKGRSPEISGTRKRHAGDDLKIVSQTYTS